MSTKSRASRIALSLAFATIAVAAAAAPVAVKSFDKTTWKQMAASLPKPSVVVFTTTDCAFCPDVIDALARDVRQKGKPHANLYVVVMDGAGKGKALLANAHYRRTDGLYAFDGQELALRYSVNPEWRGLTPYVAMVPRKGTPQFVTGRPSEAELAALFAAP